MAKQTIEDLQAQEAFDMMAYFDAHPTLNEKAMSDTFAQILAEGDVKTKLKAWELWAAFKGKMAPQQATITVHRAEDLRQMDAIIKGLTAETITAMFDATVKKELTA